MTKDRRSSDRDDQHPIPARVRVTRRREAADERRVDGGDHAVPLYSKLGMALVGWIDRIPSDW